MFYRIAYILLSDTSSSTNLSIHHNGDKSVKEFLDKFKINKLIPNLSILCILCNPAINLYTIMSSCIVYIWSDGEKLTIVREI